MTTYLRASKRNVVTLPVFLAPAFAESRSTIPNTRSFSSSTSHHNQKKTSGVNKQRGVSALRSTGPRTQMSLPKNLVLPQPAADAAARRAEFDQDNQDHGLWQFFNAKRDTITPPGEEESHGRPWAARELRRKDYTDLLKLYWVCVKEANQIVTRQNERDRVYAGYGGVESDARLRTVRTTQWRIRKVLLERHEEYNNVKTLLQVRQLRELFPNAEEEAQFDSQNETNEPEINVREINETSTEEHESQGPSADRNQEVIKPIVDENPNISRKQKLVD